MERLTEFHGGIWGMSVAAVEKGYDRYSVFSRLAEYENTDLTPEQIREIDKLYAEKCRELAELKKNYGLPCKIGDVVYIIGECFAIPNQLDGTLYDSDGGPGTATGYYCPYEGKCPHDNEDFAGCDVCVNKKAVFEDIAKSIWIDEDGIHVCGEETTICADIGDTVFLTREEAESKLAEMEGNHE